VNLEELSLGVGIHLFFKNYFFHTIVFVIMALVYSLFALVTNVEIFDMFKTDYESPNELSPIGAGSKVLEQNAFKNSMSQMQSWLGVAFVIIWGLMFTAKTFFEEKFIYEMERKKVSASDFTVMLTHIPKSYFMEEGPESVNNNFIRNITMNLRRSERSASKRYLSMK
jgi:hypothetical protein